MTQTILITGASSGIGKATAELFQTNGWNVIATMRRPENGADLAALDNVLVTTLDVTDSDSITAAVTDGTNTLRYTAGDDAADFMKNRKALDDETFIGGLKQQLDL